MLNVFICEDDASQRENFKRIIENIITIEDFDMWLALETGNPNELVEYVSNHKGRGLYFLDVDLSSDINGIDLAVEIRKQDPNGYIVFVTTHGELSYLTFQYKIEAMDYIVKDDFENLKNKIHECIKEADKRYHIKTADEKRFYIKIGDKVINIEFNKILFFETSNVIHKIILHGVDRQIEFYSKMKELEEMLDNNFYRCHKSYIVNKTNIKEIDLKNRIAYMVNGEECYISSRYIKGLVK
ncbi:LytTR family DNA-binding domain-containing protein [Clostridium sp. YIM B02551]|uniref:LytR/AlgR family response regulator transcription factor n=1 Tax=Clostridium sp. YIM B02551 TaxID=2910679 RepID=UPI001EEBA6DB|nr:LytTR family DNA-binding domain-containing protein [Clostridium sp. YIM B02551]